MIIHETIYKKSEQELYNCGNCSVQIPINQNFIQGWTCTLNTEHEIVVTVLDAIVKLFNPSTTESVAIEDNNEFNLQLCCRCGERLRDLYLHYNLFVQLNALNSDISKLIQQFGEGPLAFALSGKEILAKSQPSGFETSEDDGHMSLDGGGASPHHQEKEEEVFGLDLEIKTEYEDPVLSFTDDDDNGGFEFEYRSNDESTILNEEIIQTERNKEVTRRSSRLAVRSTAINYSNKRNSKNRKDRELEELNKNKKSRRLKEKIIKSESIEQTVEESTTTADSPLAVVEEDLDTDGGILTQDLSLQIKSKQCFICDRKYSRRSLLRIHLKRDHAIDTGIEERTYQRKDVQCPHCPILRKSKSQLQVHINSVHLKLRHKCDLCDSSFSTAYSLKNHKRIIHLNSNPEPSLCLCTLCGKTVKNKYSLKGHMKRHLPQDLLYCEICGKGFGDKFALANHKLSHTIEKNHICDICGKSYKTLKHLRNHKQNHQDKLERKTKCSLCQRGFPNKKSLTDHLLSRTHGLSLEEARKTAGIQSARHVEIIEAAQNLI